MRYLVAMAKRPRRAKPGTYPKGEAIAKQREKLGWSKQDLADRLRLTLRSIQKYESGTPPTGPVAELLKLFVAGKITDKIS